LVILSAFFIPFFVHAATLVVSTTTITVSICGDSLVNGGEECDTPGEIGVYSTTIVGRQCTPLCQWGPYCGDAILQTLRGEECDDGNNTDNDFCSALCLDETSDSGSGASSGGGGSGGTSNSGGSPSLFGDTQISVQGYAYPNVTVNILIDGVSVGTVRTNSQGEFLYNTNVDPGATSISFWATDNAGTRSRTFTTTFDVTQGAVTNVKGILLPPTIKVQNVNVNPGDIVTVTGQAPPSTSVEVYVDDGATKLTATSDTAGKWSLVFDTSKVTIDTHTLKARYIQGTTLKSESSFGTVLSLFVGVEGKATSNSDLNRDGFVNLTDFSILIYWWGTTGGNSNPPADINQNGDVALEDFSILLFNWTG